jgi:hypothetical protein
MSKLHVRPHDRHPRHLHLAVSRNPEPSHWTDQRVAELVELAWSTGKLQEQHGIATWRDDATFDERVAAMAAFFSRNRAAGERRRRVPRRVRRRRFGASVIWQIRDQAVIADIRVGPSHDWIGGL